MMIISLIAVLFTLSIILIMIDKNNSKMNLVPIKVKNESDIREKLHPNAEISDADDFLNEVAKVNESWGGSSESIAKSYLKFYIILFPFCKPYVHIL